MQQREELDAIFGKRPEAPQPADDRPEQLEIYVTTNKRDTYKCVTIGMDSALGTLPVVMVLVRGAILHYLQPADEPDVPRD